MDKRVPLASSVARTFGVSRAFHGVWESTRLGLELRVSGFVCRVAPPGLRFGLAGSHRGRCCSGPSASALPSIRRLQKRRWFARVGGAEAALGDGYGGGLG